jgi:hypothetical protein
MELAVLLDHPASEREARVEQLVHLFAWVGHSEEPTRQRTDRPRHAREQQACCNSHRALDKRIPSQTERRCTHSARDARSSSYRSCAAYPETTAQAARPSTFGRRERRHRGGDGGREGL